MDFESLDDLFRETEIAKPAETLVKPFKFLDPYGIEDRDIFFGRDLEISEIYSRFYRSRILLVYGESGSGKTSLVQCGLGSEIPAEDVQFVTVRSAVSPLASLQKEILRIAAIPGGESFSCADMLQEAVFIKSKTIGLIFDQFEEFFIFQPSSVREQFVLELTDWLARDLNIRIIICIREEYLARMTEMEASVPRLYQNRLWVRRMSREQAREVIVEPCGKCGVGIETELAGELLDVMTRGGKGVELPILQVVLDTLYHRAVRVSSESPCLTLGAYQEMGRIESILARFIEEKVGEYEDPEPARQVLKALVTPEGTRRVSSKEEIAGNAAQFGAPIPETGLDVILNRLTDDRIIREDADNRLFELRHDTLAQIIRQWMTGIEQELMEVRQTLENRFREYQVRGTLLDAPTLKYVAPYKSRLLLKPEVAELVEASEKEAERKRRWLMAIVGSAVGLFVLVVSLLGMFGYMKSVDAERERVRAEQKASEAKKEKARAEEKALEAEQKEKEARHNLGFVFSEKAERAIESKNFNAGRLYALHALASFDPDRPGAGKAKAAEMVMSHPDYPVIFSSPVAPYHDSSVLSVSFSPDGKTLASGSKDKPSGCGCGESAEKGPADRAYV